MLDTWLKRERGGRGSLLAWKGIILKGFGGLRSTYFVLNFFIVSFFYYIFLFSSFFFRGKGGTCILLTKRFISVWGCRVYR